VELYLHTPNTFSLRGASLSNGYVLMAWYLVKHRDNLTFPLIILNGYIIKAEISDLRGCIQKFPDWPPGARTANGTALCH
jgi:hypothetical protein